MSFSQRFIWTVPVLCAAFIFSSCSRSPEVEEEEVGEEVAEPEEEEIDWLAPVRPFPAKFAPRETMPDVKETEASGKNVNSRFSPGRDLIYVDDSRVWWESDHDGEEDDECDHSMHRAMELPFRRLVELCAASNAQLRVQEVYRPVGTHATLSLHKEGRAIDLTCPMLDPQNPNPERPTAKSLEILCKLAWAAGFDWVYYEQPRNKYNGPHLHASVRPDGPDFPERLRPVFEPHNQDFESP